MGGGYIEWYRGTGDNVELTHIRAGTGDKDVSGTELLKEMVRALTSHPPYATIYGFTRTCNTDAHKFYRRNGFDLSPVKGVYADGDAVLFSANYLELCKGFGIAQKME